MKKTNKTVLLIIKIGLLLVSLGLFYAFQLAGIFWIGNFTGIFNFFKTETAENLSYFLFPALNTTEAILALISHILCLKDNSALKEKIERHIDLATFSRIMSIFNIINVAQIVVAAVMVVVAFRDFG